jgi:hypothetical protein
MKIASTARQLPGRKTKDEEYGRNEAFSNRRSSYTFDLPLAGRENGLDVYRDLETGKKMYVGRTTQQPPAR